MRTIFIRLKNETGKILRGIRKIREEAKENI